MMIKKVDKIFGQRVSNKKLFKPSSDKCNKNGKPAYYERTTELGTKIKIMNPQWDMTKKVIEHYNGTETTVFKNNTLLKRIQEQPGIYDVFKKGKWEFDLEPIKSYLKNTIKK